MRTVNTKIRMASDYITIANGFKKIANKYRSIIDINKDCVKYAELYDDISKRFRNISDKIMK